MESIRLAIKFVEFCILGGAVVAIGGRTTIAVLQDVIRNTVHGSNLFGSAPMHTPVEGIDL